MKTRKMAHREPAHNEKGFKGSSSGHTSYGSPASLGASKGGGSHPGAGELPAVGPGRAGRRISGRDSSETPMAAAPSGAAPKGMRTYREGDGV